MGRIAVVNNVTLDGVMQGPGRPDEDERGGFTHGGWAIPYQDETTGRLAGEGMAGGGSLLLGRRTYAGFAGYWPQQSDNPFTPILDATRKYVVSSTLPADLPWQNSTLIPAGPGEDPLDAVEKLRADGNLVVLGSGALVRSLLRRDLVDDLTLLTFPLVLGTGQRLFDQAGVPAALKLTETFTSSTGVIVAKYSRAR